MSDHIEVEIIQRLKIMIFSIQIDYKVLDICDIIIETVHYRKVYHL